jgi:hypothetical protein
MTGEGESAGSPLYFSARIFSGPLRGPTGGRGEVASGPSPSDEDFIDHTHFTRETRRAANG